MGDFYIHIRSFQDVQDFIRLAFGQFFQVWLGAQDRNANATSYLALASLDHRNPLRVSAECGEAEFAEFRRQAASFVAE